MWWIKLDADFHTSARVLAAGRNGRDVFLRLLCLNGRGRFDGVVPASQLSERVMAAVIQCPLKIGRSRDPLSRLSALQTANPIRLRLRGYIRGGCDLETVLQRRYSAALIHGEWFAPTAEILALFDEEA